MTTEFHLRRVAAGLDIDGAADFLGVTPSTIRNWDSGKTDPKKHVMEMMKMTEQKCTRPRPAPARPDFTFIDLFAGIGGTRMGFEASGGQCVFTSEWDKYSVQTYARNFGNDHPIAGDITKIDAEDIPPHDVMLAGFPCQPFSIAGVSKKNALGRAHGFNCTTQGTLFFDIERIIDHHRPAAFMLENVKNLKSHDKGKTFQVIMDTLQNKLGYRVRTEVIDGRAWVPQHRERIFLVGFREDMPFEFDQVKIPPKNKHPRMKDILHNEDGEDAPEEPYTTGNIGRVNEKYTLTNHMWRYLRDYAAKHKAAGNGFGFGLVGPDDVARTLSARYYKDGSEILVSRGLRKNPRRLTPRECARLMGFDQPGFPKFEIPVSDTQAYKQFGNAVIPFVVEAIAKAMRPHILASLEQETDTRISVYG